MSNRQTQKLFDIPVYGFKRTFVNSGQPVVYPVYTFDYGYSADVRGNITAPVKVDEPKYAVDDQTGELYVAGGQNGR